MLWFAGVDESYSPHSTRHAVGFILYGKTKDVRLVQEFLGHTSLTSTQIYTAVDPKAMVAAAEGLW
jgi:site-specific recombinase XerD